MAERPTLVVIPLQKCLQNDLAVELGGRNLAPMICRFSALNLRSALLAALAFGCVPAFAQQPN
ncbi:MAG TPA: hypothetical protein VK512_07165, partial [Xanthobacteraceae bacterium]|nr:hypothetical protein [Xanthobacteraceae bacterium]